MKTWTSTLAATAILAVAAPAGYAANGNLPAGASRSHSHQVPRVTDPLPSYATLLHKKQVATFRALIAEKKALAARHTALSARLKAALATIRLLTAPSPIVGPAPVGCSSHTSPSSDSEATDQLSTESPASEPAAAQGRRRRPRTPSCRPHPNGPRPLIRRRTTEQAFRSRTSGSDRSATPLADAPSAAGALSVIARTTSRQGLGDPRPSSSRRGKPLQNPDRAFLHCRDQSTGGSVLEFEGVSRMHGARALAIAGATFSLVLAAASVAGISSASSGTSGGDILRFSTYPKRTLPGKTASVAITGPTAKDVCSLSVRYAGGPLQPGLRSIRVGARPTVWTWTVPRNAPPGTARVSVSCKSAGKLTGLLEIVAPPLPIDVVKQGFSLRSKFGRAQVSYGVVLANRSTREDALEVFVLVNFVNASNVLIGSESTNLDAIPAGTQYDLGGSLSFPGAAPVDHLEVVVKVGDRQPARTWPSRRSATSASCRARTIRPGWTRSTATC